MNRTCTKSGLRHIRTVVASILVAAVFCGEITKPASSQLLSMSVYKGMTAVQEALQNEEYDVALDKLNTLLARGDRLKKYDRAKVLEMIASVRMAQEKYPQAITNAEQALQLGVLEDTSVAQLHQRLFYLYLFQENYDKAIENVEIWFKLEPNPDIQSYFTAAQIYAMAEKMDQALRYALKGMHRLEGMPDLEPRESWFQLLASIYLQSKNYKQAAEVLEHALVLWPHKDTWYLQLSGVYQELNRQQDALSILAIAYRNGLLDKESDISRLAQMYRYFEYPYKGALILSEAIKHQQIKSNETNWEQTANAFLQAREWLRAETSLKKAAKLSNSGIHWLRLCQTSFQDERWTDSQRYCSEALKKGELGKEEGTAWYLLGLGRYYENNVAEAKKAFDRCSRWDATQNDCEIWAARLTKILVDKEEELELKKRQQQGTEKRRQELQAKIEKALSV